LWLDMLKRYSRFIWVSMAIAMLTIFLPNLSTAASAQLPPVVGGAQESQTTADSSQLVYGTISLNGRKLFDVSDRPSLAQKTRRHQTPLQQRIIQIESRLKQVITTEFNPKTLSITSKEYQGYTVLISSDLPPFQPIPIVEIAERDSQLYGQLISRLTPNAIERLKQILIKGYEELQPTYIHRQIRISIVIVGATIWVSVILLYVERLIKFRFKRNTQNQPRGADRELPLEDPNLDPRLSTPDRDLNQKEQKEIFRLQTQISHGLQLLIRNDLSPRIREQGCYGFFYFMEIAK